MSSEHDNGRVGPALQSAEEETEVRIFDELLKLPKANRARLLEAIRVYELLQETADLERANAKGN